METLEITTVLYHMDFLSGQPLHIAKICSIRFRYRNISVDKATHQAIGKEAAFHPPLPPQFPKMWRLDNDGSAGKPGDRGCEQARVEQVTMQDVDRLLLQKLSQPHSARHVRESAKLEWKH